METSIRIHDIQLVMPKLASESTRHVGLDRAYVPLVVNKVSRLDIQQLAENTGESDVNPSGPRTLINFSP